MKLRILFICLNLFIISGINYSIAQNIDPAKVKVDELSDEQILKLIAEMEKKGLSESEAIALARAKGMSNQQISKLQQRIKEVKVSGVKPSKTSKNSNKQLLDNDIDDEILSTKEVKEYAEENKKIFGFTFFNSTNLTFEPSVNIPVSKSYILGSGDEIIIEVWGASQQSYQLVINKNGEINIPLVGPVSLSGQSIEYAEKRIKSALSSIYSDLNSSNPRTFASIRIGQIKAINVSVIGEAIAPGTYTVPGTSTLFNILYLSGGPNEKGSYRNIKLIRNGEEVSSLDVYDFLINGKSSINQHVLDGDIVLIPTYDKRIKIAGEFKRNGIFEGKGNETVSNIVKYAGGYTENAYRNSIKLYRNNGIERTFKEVNESNIGKIVIENGDSIYIGKILNRFQNIVSIEGAVFNPGDYEYTEGLDLNQLINKADGLLENAFVNRGLITRLKEDRTLENISFNVVDIIKGNKNIDLKKNDKIFIAAIDSTREQQTVAIWGEVQKNGVYPYADNLTIADLVLKAGGFKETASESTIEVRRRLPYEVSDKSTDKSSELFYFSVSRNLKLNNEANKFVLQPFDEIAVRFMPGAIPSGSITISGEIMYGGIYNLTSDNERISDVIKRAGGLSLNAYPSGATLIRKIKLTKEEQARREEMMERDTTIVFSDLNFENVSVDLKEIMDNVGSKRDIYMRDGDILRIPSALQTVKVSGEVLNPSSTVYEKKIRVKKYINTSGGFALNAKKGKTYVIRPNGSSQATKGFLFFRKYPKVTPGSEIIVPKKPERQPMSPQAWIGIGSALASLSLAVITVMDRLK